MELCPPPHASPDPSSLSPAFFWSPAGPVCCLSAGWDEVDMVSPLALLVPASETTGQVGERMTCRFLP